MSLQLFNWKKYFSQVLFLYFLTSLGSSEISAQSLGDFNGSMIWDATEVVFDEPHPAANRSYYSSYLYFSGDTLIKDTLYQILNSKLYCYSGTSANGTPFKNCSLGSKTIKAFFHFDSTTQITYMRLPDSERAFPRYYSNLEVGDTIRYYELKAYPEGAVYTDLVVKDIEAINYFGDTRQKIILEGNPYYLENEYITGIGGMNGLIHFLKYASDYDYGYISCLGLEKEFEKYDPSVQGKDCKFEYTTEQITNIKGHQYSLKKWSVYPNPADNFIHIDLMDDHIKSIQILNLPGAILSSHTSSTINKTTSQLDISNLPKGMYILLITATSGVDYRHKFIKQ